ncbi:MAG TPA: Dabb family protein [Anaeromyxobacter sp.]
MMKHIVMWKLKDHAVGRDRAANAARMKAELESLLGRIPGLLHLEVGLNVEPSDAAFDVVLYSEFEDADALTAYQTHPEHARVAEFIGRVRAERVLVDYSPS